MPQKLVLIEQMEAPLLSMINMDPKQALTDKPQVDITLMISMVQKLEAIEKLLQDIIRMTNMEAKQVVLKQIQMV